MLDSSIASELQAGFASGDIPQKVVNSVVLLLKGYVIGLVLAMIFTALAMMSRIGNDLLETLTSIPSGQAQILAMAVVFLALVLVNTAAMAMPMPVLPEVASIKVSPG